MDPVAILLGAVGNMLKLFLPNPAFWLIALVLLAMALCSLPVVKGWIGEWVVNLQARLYLSKREYAMVPNVTIPDGLGGTTQIDHVVVSRYGVFVVETKNMKGWIYGGEQDREWTQKLGPRSYKFQNPLRQNFKHTETLAGILDLSREKIFSCIAFVGDGKLKTRDKLPPSVRTNAGWVTYVKQHRTQVLADQEVTAVLERIEEARLAPGFRTNREHVRYVKGLKGQSVAAPACVAPAAMATPAPKAAPSPRPSQVVGLCPARPAAKPAPAKAAPVRKVAASPKAKQVTPPPELLPFGEGSACPQCGGGILFPRTVWQGPNTGKSVLGCSCYPKCDFTV